jgi:hypothetical protein
MNPHTVTIINKINNKGQVTYYMFELVGVHFQDKQGIRTGETSAITDNQGYVQVPYSVDGYLPSVDYEKLSDKSNNWTIKEGDFIAKGSHKNEPFNDIANKRVIADFENVDYGITIAPHFGIYLK